MKIIVYGEASAGRRIGLVCQLAAVNRLHAFPEICSGDTAREFIEYDGNAVSWIHADNASDAFTKLCRLAANAHVSAPHSMSFIWVPAFINE